MTSPKTGAIFWVCCLQYFFAEAVAILGVRGPYSLRANFISDLGAIECSAEFCSPLHMLMNGSFLLQGALILAGALCVRRLFPRGWAWTAAIGLIGASGLGVFVVGLAPEDVAPNWHYLGAAENFVFCNSGAALLGAALLSLGPAFRGVGALTLLAGVVGLIGLAGIAAHVNFGLGVGGVERLTAYPFPLWISGMGLWLLHTGGPEARA